MWDTNRGTRRYGREKKNKGMCRKVDIKEEKEKVDNNKDGRIFRRIVV